MFFRTSILLTFSVAVLLQPPSSLYSVHSFTPISPYSRLLSSQNHDNLCSELSRTCLWDRINGGEGVTAIHSSPTKTRGPTNEIVPVTDCQLPIDWYISEEIYALEQEHIFRKMPQYIGHELMVPQPRNFHTLDWMNSAKVLINNKDKVNVRKEDERNGCGIDLLSNICRHRQAIMLKGSGKTQNVLCPLHRWSFTSEGKFLGAPHFPKDQRETECQHLHLQRTPLQNWRGLLMAPGSFSDSQDQPIISTTSLVEELDSMSCRADLDFSEYKYSHTEVTEYNFNWKTFIEVYLEDYHVGPFHPGLNGFVDCDQLVWEFSNNFSVQTVGSRRQFKDQFGTPVYKNWQREVLEKDELLSDKPKYGAIWLVVYPLLMVEWYPKTLVVSHIIPDGPQKCKNVVEFYYPHDIVLHQKEYIEAQQQAYMETAVEDEEICQRMHDGRVALAKLGIDERGPYQHPMESGLQHFHQWMHKMLDPHVISRSEK